MIGYKTIILLFIPIILSAPGCVKTEIKQEMVLKPIPMKEKELLIRTISSESSECYLDAWRVAQVIRNRCKFHNKTVHEIIYQKGQFSGINTRLWNLNLNSVQAQRIANIVDSVWNNITPDSLLLSDSTLFFCNPKLVKQKTLNWFNKMELDEVSENNHHYYKIK